MQQDMASALPRGYVVQLMLAVSVATVTTCAPVRAQTSLPDSPEAFGAVLNAWAMRHHVERTFVVVRRDGRIVYRHSIGGADSAAPVHLASLSKAITGACVATLIRDGKLSLDMPLSSALANFAVRSGGLSQRFGRVTVAQLLSHRAGFGTLKDDPGTGPALVSYLKTHTAKARPSAEFLAWALNQPLVHEPGAKFVYSNTGYLALGLAIEQAAGERYVPYCRREVLAPLKLRGDLAPNWQIMWSYGGWRMTADDYLSFLDLFAADDQRLGVVAKRWMLDPEGKTVSEGGEMWYGLGTYVRKGENGVNVRHFGSWAYNMIGMDGLLKTSFLTLAVRQSDGTAWFAYIIPRPRVEKGELGPGIELERELLAAYRGVKKWK